MSAVLILNTNDPSKMCFVTVGMKVALERRNSSSGDEYDSRNDVAVFEDERTAMAWASKYAYSHLSTIGGIEGNWHV